jgi:hypothetical protein
MADYRVYVVPEVDIDGERRPIVLRTRLGLIIAASMTPNFRDAFQIDDGEAFKNKPFFIKTIDDAVKGKNGVQVEDTIMKFQRGYRGLNVTRISAEEIRPHTYAAFLKSRGYIPSEKTE